MVTASAAWHGGRSKTWGKLAASPAGSDYLRPGALCNHVSMELRFPGAVVALPMGALQGIG